MNNNDIILRLPELNLLRPTKETTFKKLVEEMAECNAAIIELNGFENPVYNNKRTSNKHLMSLLGEIIDIAQVCSSQLFVLSEEGIDTEILLEKSRIKIDSMPIIKSHGGSRYISFKKSNKYISLQDYMNEIIKHIGNIAQLAKFIGENGEKKISIDVDMLNEQYVENLLNIIEKCFRVLYSLNDTYCINFNKIQQEHLTKLQNRGYCKF